MLIDTWHSVNPVDSDASPAIRLICDEKEIVWALTHVKARFQLALCHHTPTGNVSNAVLRDALWKQDHVRRQLAYFRRDASPHLMANENREPPVVMGAHMAANALE
eukprot:COSAG06_NODE_17876_length_916_cov_1.582619_1_plen_106_part_00